jgi:hypothetical protein
METSEHHRSGGPQQRAQARRVSGLAYAATLTVFLWWFSARLGLSTVGGAMVAALVVLPWCALLMIARWRGIVHTDSSGVYRGVAALFHVPGLLLCVTAIADVHLLAWQEALLLTGLGGAAFAALALRLERRPTRKRQAVVMMALIAFAYAYGVVAQADTRLDRAPPQRFTVPVLAKHLSGGTRSPLRRYLTVEPWGPRAEIDDITVDGETFNAVRRDASVCISLHPGTLGIPWYSATACA